MRDILILLNRLNSWQLGMLVITTLMAVYSVLWFIFLPITSRLNKIIELLEKKEAPNE